MRAIFSVKVGGEDISSALSPILHKLSVSDRAGSSSDSASLEIDDTDGRIIMPEPRDPITIMLGWEDKGMGVVFQGVVDEVRAVGSRSGRMINISAKGMDTRGKAKEGQRRHFDDKTISEIMKATGETAGIECQVDEELAKIKRPYVSLDDESFVAFGERIAKEIGGTFKIVGDKAVLAKRNGGRSTSGAALSSVTARWGDNLHSYDVTPILGRPVEKKTRSRWYDRKQAEWKEETAETETEDGETERSSRYSEASQDRAKEQAGSDAAESDRKSGEGSVTIEGNISAQPEGICQITDCRHGIDGDYRIEGVDHEYSRSGFITRLELGQPKGGAGKDKRGKKKSGKKKGGGDGASDYALPKDAELG